MISAEPYSVDRRSLLLLLALPLVACGEESGRGPGSDERHGTQREPRQGVIKSGADRETGESTRPRRRGDSDEPSRPRTIRTKGGGTIVLPAPPTRTAAEPSSNCSLPPTPETEASPPLPGVTARAEASGHIRVRYWFRARPRRCQPHEVVLTLFSSDGTNPSISRPYPLRGRVTERVVVPPAYFRTTPDVIRARSVTRDGRLSPNVSVRVR